MGNASPKNLAVFHYTKNVEILKFFFFFNNFQHRYNHLHLVLKTKYFQCEDFQFSFYPKFSIKYKNKTALNKKISAHAH